MSASLPSVPLLPVLIGLSACGNAEPAGEGDIVRLIAEQEQLDPDDVQILAIERARDTTTVLYRLTPPATWSSPLGPIQMRHLVHPPLRPLTWTLGGGSPAETPAPGCAVTLGVRSGRDDTPHDINTVIYGVTDPMAATVEVTVRGARYRQPVQHGGYIILLEDQAVTLYDFTGMQVLDAQGNELPIPCVPTSLFGG